MLTRTLPVEAQPWRKKIDGISLTCLRRQTGGAINFYRNMFCSHSKVLAAITKLTCKDVKFQWGADQQLAIEHKKALISEAVLIQYPDPSQPLAIHPAASEIQLGSAIRQNNQLFAQFI